MASVTAPFSSASPTSRTVMQEVMQARAAQGFRLQSWLRLALVGFVWASLLAAPPSQYAGWCFAVAAAYLLLCAAIWSWLRRYPATGGDRRWLFLLLDIAVLATLTVVAGESAVDTWTAYIVVTGFFLLPVMTATQLSPQIGAVLAVPTVAAYLFSTMTTREVNGEPWASLILRAAVLVAVCAGSVVLSQVQRSRLQQTVALATTRADLLVELTALEERERTTLADALHDGALQYVLAARLDLQDARDGSDADAFARVDYALGESTQLLRSTVGELHPAVLDRAGIARAVEDLATGMRRRGLDVRVDVSGLPEGTTTTADRVVFAAVREAFANIVKHADARSVTVEIALVDQRLSVQVVDDGVGIDPSALAGRVAAGHIGLASQRLRVEAFGGRFAVTPAQPHGTRVHLDVPAQPQSLGTG